MREGSEESRRSRDAQQQLEESLMCVTCRDGGLRMGHEEEMDNWNFDLARTELGLGAAMFGISVTN